MDTRYRHPPVSPAAQKADAGGLQLEARLGNLVLVSKFTNSRDITQCSLGLMPSTVPQEKVLIKICDTAREIAQ